jgi:hypothetical protein
MVAMADKANPPGDPSGIEQPHDVLAAEEFAMPTRDNRFPADPLGTTRPHDVLAAEEFGIPGPGAEADVSARSPREPARYLVPLAIGFALAFILLRRR